MLREGDNRDGTYAEAPFASSKGVADAAYYGLRRFPYSTDRTKNDLSFRHIADASEMPTGMPGHLNGNPNSEPHNVGEVWATMLWEAFNVLVDAHDVPTARRRMSDYVVAGLLLTPADATITEGRDAILAAASALDTDDMLLMAAAFATRGAGSCAVGPSNSSPGYAGLVESRTLAAKLEIGDFSLTDDGVSCDHDGVLDPGESGTLRMTVVNAGAVAAENLTVTPTTTATGVRFGAAIHLPLLAPYASVELAFPVNLLPSAAPDTTLTITAGVTGDITCERDGVSFAFRTRTGIDEPAGTSRVDHVETSQTPWTLTGNGAASLWSRPIEPSLNHTWFGVDAGFPSDTQLVSPVLLPSTTAPLVVKLAHAYAFESDPTALYDGGVIEVSTDGGGSWTDVSQLGVDPGYTGPLFVGADNPIAGRPAFGGISPGFPARSQLVLDFGTQFAGQSVQLRFRIGSDDNSARSGWIIDDIEVSGTTNVPFPSVQPEPTICTARRAPGDAESAVIATHAAPATSLDAFDAVCVSYDNP